jgi:anti-anti-sigma factor
VSIEADERASGIGFLISWEGDECVLHVRGEVDGGGETLLVEAVKTILDSECRVVVDLVAVRFTGAGGAGALHDVASSARVRGQSVRLRLAEAAPLG